MDKWWAGFNDPDLTQLIGLALHQNLDLVASLARVEQARAAAREAGANLLPTSYLQAQSDSLHQSVRSPLGALASHAPGYFRDGTDYDVGIGASWEVDLFGGLRRHAQAAAAQAQAAEAEELGLKVSITAEVADAYLQLRGYQARIDFAHQQIATDAHLLDLIQSRAANGAASRREIAQAQALLLAARATVPPLQTTLEAQLNRLDLLLGAQPGTYARDLALAKEIPLPPAFPVDLTPAVMLRRRPDIMVAERHLAASNALIGAAMAEYYPKISVAGLLGFETLDEGLAASDLFSSQAFQPELVAGLRWRLFDFGKIDAQVAQANSARAALLAQYRQAVLTAVEDVENAFTSFYQLEFQLREVSDEVAALRVARNTSEEAYEAGSIPLTDVLDADRELLSAQDQFAQVRADSARAAVELFRSFGGGW
jgi:NodT family efflux transporter outer membrane factor (OMF) lipoprotein